MKRHKSAIIKRMKEKRIWQIIIQEEYEKKKNQIPKETGT